MSTRIALMSVRLPFVGSWMRARATDSAIRVSGLGPGESIYLEGDGGVQFDRNGTFPFHPVPGHRFRFIKLVGTPNDPSATTVEIVS